MSKNLNKGYFSNNLREHLIKKYIGQEIWNQTKNKETRMVLIDEALKTFKREMISKFGSCYNWFKDWCKRNGYKSTYEYYKNAALNRGFKSEKDYRDSLARKKGFKDFKDYKNKKRKLRGFKSNKDYLDFLAKEKGFKNFQEYKKSLKKKEIVVTL